MLEMATSQETFTDGDVVLSILPGKDSFQQKSERNFLM